MRADPRTSVRCTMCASPVAGSAITPRSINFSFVDARWEADFVPATTIRSAVLNPIASHLSVMRTHVARRPDQCAVVQPEPQSRSRSRVRDRPRVPARSGTAPMARLQVGGVAQPMRVAAARVRPGADEQWGCTRARVDFFDVKGDSRRCSPAARASTPAQHPALHPGRRRAIDIDGARSAGSASCIRAGSSNTTCRRRRSCSSSTLAAAAACAPCRGIASCRGFTPVRRDISVIVADSDPVAAIIDAVHGGAVGPPPVQPCVNLRHSMCTGSAYSSKVAEASANVLLNKEKSLAFRVVMQDTERTLSDAEADAAVEVDC